ncbi:hypothetical protein E3P96_03437 [Wallemia ichthyophaga]|nr:hypothetical protein E3P96_03437 [Wallemia ichthyophaga]
MSSIREATHAGAWYSANPSTLTKQLTGWFSDAADAGVTSDPKCRVVIAPHAGLSFSGRTAAHAYSAATLSNYKRIIMLGPSHHVYLDSCALSPFSSYDTPFGPLSVDKGVNDDLAKCGAFKRMSRSTDEDEHSFEMHTPFIKTLSREHDIKIVPILIGSLSHEQEVEFGAYLSQYINDPETLFAISSDFSHWGSRFRYTYYRPSPSSDGRRLAKSDSTHKDEDAVHESITGLDHEAWDILSGALSNPQRSHENFTKYLRKTGNTICGRHAFGVLLGAIRHANKDYDGHVQWTHYSQSSKALSANDSSVSYSGGYMAF